MQQAGLFVISGTMAQQIALKIHSFEKVEKSNHAC